MRTRATATPATPALPAPRTSTNAPTLIAATAYAQMGSTPTRASALLDGTVDTVEIAGTTSTTASTYSAQTTAPALTVLTRTCASATPATLVKIAPPPPQLQLGQGYPFSTLYLQLLQLHTASRMLLLQLRSPMARLSSQLLPPCCFKALL